MRLVLTAQQTGAFQVFGFELLLDLPRGHDVQEARLEGVPFQSLLAIVREQRVIRREFRRVPIGDAADGFQEVGQVGGLGEACKLGCVLKAHVDHRTDPGALQAVEEILGRGFGEADGEGRHARRVPFVRCVPNSHTTVTQSEFILHWTALFMMLIIVLLREIERRMENPQRRRRRRRFFPAGA